MKLGPFYLVRVRPAKLALWGHTATHCLSAPLRRPETWTVTVTADGVTRIFEGATVVLTERVTCPGRA